jgi:MFS family permease
MTLLRSMVPTVFLPVGLYEIGNGAMLPVVALTALDMGASLGLAALIAAFAGIGQIVGNVPAAWFSARVGDRWSMLSAASVMTACSVVCALRPPLVVFGAALLVMGMANATFYLARQLYLTDAAPAELRGRVMSLLSGSHRIGALIGPFAGSAVIALIGTSGAFVVATFSAVSAALVLIVPGGRTRGGPGSGRGDGRNVLRRPTLTALWDFKLLFLTLGSIVLLARAVQASRSALIPLWANQIGLDPGATSLLFGMSGLAEAALFYPAGKIMDSYGRLAAGLPAILMVAISLLVLPLTGNGIQLAATMILGGVGQGLGSGLFFTLAADAAPERGRNAFLAVWRFFSDFGTASGPVLVAFLVATVAATASTAIVIGCIGVAVAVAERRFVPRYSNLATPAAVRAFRR